MAQNVIINSVTYQNVPEVDIPKSGGGTAKFYDTASADVTGAEILTGKTAFGASGSVSGSMANNGSTSGTISTKAGTVTIPADIVRICTCTMVQAQALVVPHRFRQQSRRMISLVRYCGRIWWRWAIISASA